MKTKASIDERIEKLLEYISTVQKDELSSFTEFDFCEEKAELPSKKKTSRKPSRPSSKN